MIKVGIIGGSGLGDPGIIDDPEEKRVNTPYGKPSSPLTLGKIKDIDVILLSRHGKEHQITPTKVNYRANIHALKEQGVTHVVATTACGSLKKDIGRGCFVILDQFIDFTRHRQSTFYDSFDKHVVHIPMANPFDEGLRRVLYETSIELGLKVRKKGTVITIEGPRFSTKAESNMFRMWGADVVNMSIATEVILANEAQIPYCAVAMSTDYDCWKEDEPDVSWDEIMKVFNHNIDGVKELLVNVIPKISNMVEISLGV